MRMHHVRAASIAGLLALCFVVPGSAQELPLSGVSGYDLFYATSPTGLSRLFTVNVQRSLDPIPVGPMVDAVPSRWAHRRRTLGALETAVGQGGPRVYITPMGDAVGNGALHFVDLRAGVESDLVATGNPAAYDVLILPSLSFAFTAEDDGLGNTVLRGFSYAVAGSPVPLSPASLTLAGPPSAYVNRISVDQDASEMYVATTSGIRVVSYSASVPNMSAGPVMLTAPRTPTTNPHSFERNGLRTWIVGTCRFDGGNTQNEAGYFAWDLAGTVGQGPFGQVPSNPAKNWVPGPGVEELCVVGDGTNAYAYYLLREPRPGTFFIKPAAVGVVRFIGPSAPVVSTILMPDDVGEPFANPAAFGTRVAFESSFGPPFNDDPPGGGEKISIIYSPLDPLGVSSLDGVLGVPAPLGGRISTKGMDRPIWSRDGTRVMAATSHFPGAPNPGIPGLEVLDVPADVVLDQFQGPHTVVPNLPFPNQSIILPSGFDPRVPALATAFEGLSFFGNVFNQGLASLAVTNYGEVGQHQPNQVGFTQDPNVPNFPALFPPAFLDATGSTVAIPDDFGARRTAFNFTPDLGIPGLTMVAAIEDTIYVQMTGINLLASFGIGMPVDPIEVVLPPGWVTTTEFLSF